MVKVKKDLTGMVFGRLTVVGQADDYIRPDGRHEAMWDCLCSCGNPEHVLAIGYKLKNGKKNSCGCLGKEALVKNGLAHVDNLLKYAKERRKHNEYDLSGPYGIGIAANGEEFFFDLEDYDLIKDYRWYIDKNGYVSTTSIYSRSATLQHRIIMGVDNTNDFVDHISHNKRDNRKKNLRIVTPTESGMNRSMQSNNTSGITGVYFHKPSGLWCGYIKIHGKQYKKYANTKEEAEEKRIALEKKYFKEYSYRESIKQAEVNENV